jgi:hypothetical protein
MTKEKRMRMKREKKNLRRKNEMKRKKNLKSSLPTKSSSVKYSPIKFDCFGKVSRFVNRKGDVLPTDTEMFGCEIVKDLPNSLRDYLKLVDLDVVIKVPVTNHEVLTGSGDKGDCHTNSSLLSLSVGGNRLYGFTLFQWGKSLSDGFKENITLHSHSVWITPEGKTRCVTDYHLDCERTEILFIPIGLNDFEDCFKVKNRSVDLCSSSKYIQFMDKDRNLEERVKIRDVLKYKKLKGSHNLLFNDLVITTKTPRLSLWKVDIENSHFGKVSSTTGRSWDYFKNKILNTYFPTSLTLKTPKMVI